MTGAGPEAARGPSSIPRGSLALGDYQRGSSDAVSRAFAQTVSQRYGAGLALNTVTADLGRQQFACRAGGGRGDPPDQMCRRSLQSGGCTHTWQVLLYNDGGARGLSRTRGLYDRACGDGELLGGR